MKKSFVVICSTIFMLLSTLAAAQKPATTQHKHVVYLKSEASTKKILSLNGYTGQEKELELMGTGVMTVNA